MDICDGLIAMQGAAEGAGSKDAQSMSERANVKPPPKEFRKEAIGLNSGSIRRAAGTGAVLDLGGYVIVNLASHTVDGEE